MKLILGVENLQVHESKSFMINLFISGRYEIISLSIIKPRIRSFKKL